MTQWLYYYLNILLVTSIVDFFSQEDRISEFSNVITNKYIYNSVIYKDLGRGGLF